MNGNANNNLNYYNRNNNIIDININNNDRNNYNDNNIISENLRVIHFNRNNMRGHNTEPNTNYVPLCVICLINPRKIVIVPCGHRCLCQKCYNLQKDQFKKCPICRGPIKYVLENIYDS